MSAAFHSYVIGRSALRVVLLFDCGTYIVSQAVELFFPGTEGSMRRKSALGRRQFLGAAGLAGLGLGPVTAPASATGPSVTPIRSCILIFYYGGPSHLDTFDPKPNAPAEVRGEYRTIATAVPGVRICEHLPRTARMLDRVALVRSLHHPMRNHNSAAAEALTGRTPAGRRPGAAHR